MKIVSLISSVIAVLFILALLLTGARTIWPLIGAGVTGVLGIISGAIAIKERLGKAGMIIGIVCIVFELLLIGYLFFFKIA